MTENERVRELRKTLGLTLEKFGERLGVKKNAISAIENGRNSLTDQMTKAICREFGVDYIWLTTGEGEMFVDTDDDFIERIDRIMAGEDEARKNLFKFMLELSDEDIAALDRLMKRRFVSQKVRLMNNDLYNVLFKLLSQSDESDIRMVCSSLLGYLVGKGKISVDELDEYISVIKKD